MLNGRRDLLPPSIFRTLWSNIETMIVDGEVCAVDEVRNELSRRDDEVWAWAKAQDNLSSHSTRTSSERPVLRSRAIRN